ncbi:MAG: YdcF family protein [Brevinematales bacterium]
MKSFKLIDFIFIFFLIVFICVFGWQVNFKPENKLDQTYYSAVVFGAGITKSGKPSLALMYRLDKATELYKDLKVKKIIVSGKIPETIVMRNYLLLKLVKLEDIIIDIKGINTANTIKNIKKLEEVDPNFDSFVFVSQRFHLARIFLLAHKYRIKNFSLVSTDLKEVEKFDSFMMNLRETFAIFKSLLFE